MVSLILALILVALVLLAVSLRKVYFCLPINELKRQAEIGDQLAQRIWQAVSYGLSLRILLWLWLGLSAAGSFVLLARLIPPYFSFLVIALLLWLAFVWLPNARISRFSSTLASQLTPVIVWVLNYLQPLLRRLANLWQNHFPARYHTGLFEADDLTELIDRQQQQPDSRLSQTDLDRVERAISFSKRHVRDILVPRKKVKALSASDAVGPILLDELHASGHSRFPVYEGKKEQIVGTLLSRRLDIKSAGKVADFMEPRVAYVHENDSLSEALQAFDQSQQPLLVVINGAEDYVGIITLEDILCALAGLPETTDFEDHHQRSAVAAKHRRPKPIKAETISESVPEVLE
ncbi:MAG TPA: CBS domain-containing protein [Candidatus Dormibacteraeota bacterium]|nr:CBS domain-containing protein [Candidatus Dormibacteraeota bacterium]